MAASGSLAVWLDPSVCRSIMPLWPGGRTLYVWKALPGPKSCSWLKLPRFMRSIVTVGAAPCDETVLTITGSCHVAESEEPNRVDNAATDCASVDTSNCAQLPLQ